MLDFFKTNISIIIVFTINIILFIAVIISNARISKMNKNNKLFMQKLGTGKDISEVKTHQIVVYFIELLLFVISCIYRYNL